MLNIFDGIASKLQNLKNVNNYEINMTQVVVLVLLILFYACCISITNIIMSTLVLSCNFQQEDQCCNQKLKLQVK